jgi:hypothetical protein
MGIVERYLNERVVVLSKTNNIVKQEEKETTLSKKGNNV